MMRERESGSEGGNNKRQQHITSEKNSGFESSQEVPRLSFLKRYI
jgi:hypothetical protein